ncbi:MAG: hypothetical protein ACKO86_15295 [Dolichospermum sp.]
MHSSAKCPKSKVLCDRCYSTISGNQKQLWYWNEGKNKWSKLWGRSLSRVYQNDKLIAPVIEGTYTEGKDTFSVAKNLLTRVEIREFLLNPPDPPFTIAIAESGQKHIIPWAIEAQSRELFPVQFELDTVYVSDRFKDLLSTYESLLGLGFSKSEIDTGDYRSDKLMKVFDQYCDLDEIINKVRNTRLLQLISYVAQTPDTQDVIKNKVEVEQKLPVTEKLLEPQNKFQPPRQLTLF